jgi:hypothetical protein
VKIPLGFCHCGCGQKTNLIPETDRPKGLIKGKPYRYIKQHCCRTKAWIIEKAKKFGGFCACGCGRKTRIAPYHMRRLGWFKGFPEKFIIGHSRKITLEKKYIVDLKTGCWNWKRIHKNGNAKGYATSIRRNGISRPAYRFMWEEKHGEIPVGLDIDHLCKNRRCVNPQHLEAVSRAENIQRSLSAKLDKSQVAEIRARYRSEIITQRQLCKEYGVSPGTMCSLISGKTWVGINA